MGAFCLSKYLKLSDITFMELCARRLKISSDLIADAWGRYGKDP